MQLIRSPVESEMGWINRKNNNGFPAGHVQLFRILVVMFTLQLIPKIDYFTVLFDPQPVYLGGQNGLIHEIDDLEEPLIQANYFSFSLGAILE